VARALTLAAKRGSLGNRAVAAPNEDPFMASSRLAGVLALALLAAPQLAAAQDADLHDAAIPSTRFRCQDGGDLLARFATERGRLVAIVDALDGYGPHTLAWRPYEGGPVKLTWTDGERTLTWSPGVQIMWMAADTHRMCGRAGGHEH
jgi:hypothetical protein